ncbi:MAG: serine/threonine protein kinase [Planctomycetes bacterium]|nr:serine/threonine protein kinase [Planctomycetota bacterium]
MTDSREEQSFGQVVIKNRLATQVQVDECLAIQGKLHTMGLPSRRLGDIMVEKGYLSKEAATSVFKLQRQAPSAPVQIPGYDILGLVGKGGMGAVYKARQISMDRQVAIKVLPSKLARDPMYVERFRREAQAVAKLNHENIIQGFDVGEHQGHHFFVMEFVDGCTVQSLLKKDGALPEEKALKIVLQISHALEHAHKAGLVHRDVKPDNIMVTREEEVAKLCDLGLAKQVTSDSSLTQEGTSVGTPHYISPEQARGEQVIDIRADIYSLGASLYHMLTGHVPFDGPTAAVVMTKHLTEPPVPPAQRRPGVSEAATAITLKMMCKDAAGRYQSPTELALDLEAAVNHRPLAVCGQTSRRKSGVPAATQSRRERDSDTTVRRRQAERADRAERTDRAERATTPEKRALPLPLPVLVGGGVLLLLVALYVAFGGGPSSNGQGDGGGTRRPVPGAGTDGGGGQTPGGGTGTAGGGTAGAGAGAGPGATGGGAGTAATAGTGGGGAGSSGGDGVDKREQEARGRLESLHLRTKDAGADANRLAEVLRGWDAYIAAFMDTPFEATGRREKNDLKARIDAFAKTEVDRFDKQSLELEAGGRLSSVLDLYQTLPDLFRDTPAGKRAQGKIEQCKHQLEDLQQQTLSQVEQARKEGDFDKAIKCLQGVEVYGTTEQKREANDLLTKITEQKKQHLAERSTTAETEFTLRFQPEFEGLLRSGAYEAARQRALEAMVRDPLKFVPERMNGCVEDAGLLLELLGDAKEGLTEAARAGADGTVGTSHGKVVEEKDHFAIENSVGGGKAQRPLELGKLAAAELLQCAGLRSRQKELEETGPWQLKKGLLLFFADNRAEAKKALVRAAELYSAKGPNEPGAGRALYYVKRIEAEEGPKEREKAAQELLGKAHSLYGAKNYAECLKAIAELRQRYGTTGAVTGASPELGRMESDCEAKLAGGGAGGGAGPAGGAGGGGPRWAVEGGSTPNQPGRTTWKYEFARKEELDDWEAKKGDRGGIQWREGGGSFQVVDLQLFWRREVVGDVSVEVSLRATNRANLALTFGDNRRSEQGQAQCYYVVFNATQLPFLEGLPHRARQVAMGNLDAPNAVLRVDFAQFAPWKKPENLLRDIFRVVGSNGRQIDPAGCETTLSVVRASNQVTARLRATPREKGTGGEVEVSGNAPDWKSGFVSLCLLDTEAEVKSIKIVGVLANPEGDRVPRRK